MVNFINLGHPNKFNKKWYKIRNSNRYLYTNDYSSIIHTFKSLKQPKCLSVVEWINKMWYILKMEYYSTFKMKEILTHATSWINLECVIPSKISWIQRSKYCMITLIYCSGVFKITETGSRMVVTLGWEEGEWEVSV